jgi:hypothetical protein
MLVEGNQSKAVVEVSVDVWEIAGIIARQLNHPCTNNRTRISEEDNGRLTGKQNRRYPKLRQEWISKQKLTAGRLLSCRGTVETRFDYLVINSNRRDPCNPYAPQLLVAQTSFGAACITPYLLLDFGL